MIKKKNGFVAFICSLIQGAGEMYLGFMKEGLSIMCLAYAMFVTGAWIDASWLACSVVILWFYSLFNVHNKVSLPDEEFYTLEDNYLFHLDQILPEGRLNGRQTKVFGWLLVLFGIATVWKSSIRNLLAVLETCISSDFADLVGNYLYGIPRFVVAVILIVCGVRMILKKKIELYTEPEELPGSVSEEKNGEKN